MYLSPVDLSFRTLHPSTFFSTLTEFTYRQGNRHPHRPRVQQMSLLFSNASRFSYSTYHLSFTCSQRACQTSITTANVSFNCPLRPHSTMNVQRYDMDRKFTCEPRTRCVKPKLSVRKLSSCSTSHPYKLPQHRWPFSAMIALPMYSCHRYSQHFSSLECPTQSHRLPPLFLPHVLALALSASKVTVNVITVSVSVNVSNSMSNVNVTVTINVMNVTINISVIGKQ